jgi:hypothetical protein
MYREASDHHQEVAKLLENEEATGMVQTGQDLRSIRHQVEQVPRRLTGALDHLFLILIVVQ